MAAGSRVVVVRRARAGDEAARLRLLRDTLAETHTAAFFYFFFQELTMQCTMLLGAVLFIFCGVSAEACLLLLPGAAAVVGAAGRMHAAAVAASYPARLRTERAGWVAEYRGPLLTSRGPGGTVPVVYDHELRDHGTTEPVHREIVGSVSLSAHHVGYCGYVWGLCVAPAWRRRGAGAALLGALQADAGALHAVTSHLQPAARALMHKHGWECRSTYHRQLLGDALTLPMALLVLDLPYA